MNLREPYSRNDAPSMEDGDLYFLGVDERRAPAQLPPGYVSRAKNKRFRNGEAEPRPGIITLPWMKGLGLTPFSEVYGGAVFHDPSEGVDWILIAADGGVWRTRPNNAAIAVALPAGVTLTRATFARFAQARNSLLLLRGEGATVLECRDLDVGFIEIPYDPADGTEPLPNTSYATYFGNRTWAISGRDGVSPSDLLDYTKHHPLTNSFRINEGDSDALKAILPFNESTLVMFKERTVWKVLNAHGDLSQAIGPLNVTRQYGITSAGSAIEAGLDLFWQSELGIVSLRLNELNEEQATSRVLSEPMAETFKRLNAGYVDRGRLAVWDGKLYWAFAADDARVLGAGLVGSPVHSPAIIAVTAGQKYQVEMGAGVTLDNGGTLIEGSQTFIAAGANVILTGPPATDLATQIYPVRFEGVNNVCCVYDLQNQAWCGVDESAALLVVDFLRISVNGVPRLLFLSADGWLRMYEEGFEDSVPSWTGAAWEIVPAAIADEVLTRGLPCASARGKRYTSANLLLSTWAPSYTVATIVNGVGTETTGDVQTRTPGKAMVHGTADWVDTNVNNDHGARGREDYSVVLDDTEVDLASGINPDLHQDTAHTVAVDDKGRWMQIRIANTQGRCRLRAILLEAVEGEKQAGINFN